jgi:hypothetical protein
MKWTHLGNQLKQPHWKRGEKDKQGPNLAPTKGEGKDEDTINKRQNTHMKKKNWEPKTTPTHPKKNPQWFTNSK